MLSQNETRGVLETFWRNLYLRGTMLYDPEGTYGGVAYSQPTTNVPASRAWVIGPDQTIALTQLGHNPDAVIGTIRDLLADVTPAVLDTLDWAELHQAGAGE